MIGVNTKAHDFMLLYRKFKAGLDWVNRQRQKQDLGLRPIPDYDLEPKISDFLDFVEKPMDEAWRHLSKEDKERALQEIERSQTQCSEQ